MWRKFGGENAAELVELDVDVLPAVTDAQASLEDDAPQLHDIAPNNRALDLELGDPDEAERMIADAHHVTRLNYGITGRDHPLATRCGGRVRCHG